jgi:hypothetical protein
MDAELNPYAPPNAPNNELESFARRYRVNASKTTMREFQNLSGRPVFGTLVWLAMRIGLMRLDRQIMEGPRPFAEDQCSLDALRDPVRSHLLAKCDSAEKLGFHTRSYSVSNSTGVEAHGGAVRMLHHSERSFLQILASSSGSAFQGYEIVVSATSSDPMNVYATTNGPPNYNPPARLTTHRYIANPLQVLIDSHNKSIAEIGNLMCIPTLAEVGTVMDYLSVLFYADKVARGIFVQVPEQISL